LPTEEQIPSSHAAPTVVAFSAPATGLSARYAGFWIRFAAAVIDSLVIFTVSMFLVIPLALTLGVGAALSGSINEQATQALGALMGYSIGLSLGWLYEALMLSSRRQATLGKMAVGLIVTDLAGNRLSFPRATGRHLGKYLSSILLLGYLIQPFTEQRQALHDLLAGTLVHTKR
jgi:uncharacterized RDD family membrane protein YckC